MARDGRAAKRPAPAPELEGRAAAARGLDGTVGGQEPIHDGSFDIYLMNADGSEPRRLTESPGSDVSAAWSPDGTKIAFHVGRDVHVLDFDAANLVRLTVDPDNGMYPS
jgi:hypothetical protein